MSDRVTVRLTHRFAATPERVFDAWLDPRTAGKWLFATPTGKITRCEIDPQVGGKFFIVRVDGDEFEHIGEYLEIDRPRRLVFRFTVPRLSAEYSRVTLEFTPLAGGCELRLTHENVLADYADRVPEGWTMILNGLEKNLT